MTDVGASLTEVEHGEQVTVTLDKGRDLDGTVTEIHYEPATHDAGDGFPMRGDLSVVLAIPEEDARRADLPAEQLRITATEQSPGEWDSVEGIVPHYVGDPDNPELNFQKIGTIATIEHE